MLMVAFTGLDTSRRHVAFAVPERRGVAVDRHGLTDILERLGRLRGLLQRHQRGKLVVGLELLLDLGELHELGGELVGVERIERVLVLELRREQFRNVWKFAGDRVGFDPGRRR